MSNPYLDQVREELRAAKRDVERARAAYNEKLKSSRRKKRATSGWNWSSSTTIEVGASTAGCAGRRLCWRPY
jgi:hypothetical protein